MYINAYISVFDICSYVVQWWSLFVSSLVVVSCSAVARAVVGSLRALKSPTVGGVVRCDGGGGGGIGGNCAPRMSAGAECAIVAR